MEWPAVVVDRGEAFQVCATPTQIDHNDCEIFLSIFVEILKERHCNTSSYAFAKELGKKNDTNSNYIASKAAPVEPTGDPASVGGVLHCRPLPERRPSATPPKSNFKWPPPPIRIRLASAARPL